MAQCQMMGGTIESGTEKSTEDPRDETRTKRCGCNYKQNMSRYTGNRRKHHEEIQENVGSQSDEAAVRAAVEPRSTPARNDFFFSFMHLIIFVSESSKPQGHSRFSMISGGSPIFEINGNQ
jgi:hypothetical protein